MTGDMVSILKALKLVCAKAKVNGVPLSTERVVIGYVSPDQVKGQPVAMLMWRGDRGHEADGYEEHFCKILVGVQANYDDSDVTLQESAVLEATSVYFAVRNAVAWAARNLTDSGLGPAGVQLLRELSPDAQPEDYDTPGPVFAGTSFDCTWHKDLPTEPGS